MVAMSSIAMRTAWRSASGVSCARGCVRRAASSYGAPTIHRTHRYLRASATGSFTRSTICVASTATFVSRRARRRRSPRRRCSSSPSRIAATPSTPRPSCWLATTAGLSTCPGKTGARARTNRRRPGCAPPRRRAAPSSRARSAWSGELGYGVRAPEPTQAEADAEAADESGTTHDDHTAHDAGHGGH